HRPPHRREVPRRARDPLVQRPPEAVLTGHSPPGGVMNLEINARGADLTPQLERYVRTKVGKIDKLFDRITSIRVVFTKEKFTHRAEVVVVDKHGTTKVRESTEDFRSAFDLVLRKLESRGRKEKEI